VPSFEEITPPASPSAYAQILTGQDKLEVMIGHLTNETVGMRADVASLLSRVGLLEIRVSALELAGRYFPFVFSIIAMSLAAWALVVALKR